MKESKDQRQTRQTRQKGQYNQMIESLKEDIARSYTQKAQRDAFYINYNNIVEEVIY